MSEPRTASTTASAEEAAAVTPPVGRRARADPARAGPPAGGRRWPPPRCPACPSTSCRCRCAGWPSSRPTAGPGSAAPAIAAQLAADPLFRQRIGGRVIAEAGDLGAAVVERHRARPPPTRSRSPRWPTWPGRPAGATWSTAAGEAVARRGRQRRRRRAGPRGRAAGRPGRARPGGGPGRGRQAARRAGPGARGARPAARGGRGCSAQALREAQARERKADRAAGHREGPGRPGRRRPRRRAAPAAGPAGRGGGGRRRRAGRRAKEARAVDDARLWLLLETIGQAAVGLRRELALGPDRQAARPTSSPTRTPTGPAPPSRPRARALDADDPARLDQLLALPRAHLVVDGYNVTKRGFGEMSLEQQRKRLITGLGGIAAQTGAEVTVRLRRRRAGARAAAGAARRAGAVLPQGRDRRRADPAAGPGRAGRAAGGGGLVRPRGRRRGTPPRRLPAGRGLAAAAGCPSRSDASRGAESAELTILSDPLASVCVTERCLPERGASDAHRLRQLRGARPGVPGLPGQGAASTRRRDRGPRPPTSCARSRCSRGPASRSRCSARSRPRCGWCRPRSRSGFRVA